MNKAVQKLIVRPGGREDIRRTAECPVHERASSQFIGVIHEGWQFRCQDGHLFVAKPDPRAPGNSEGEISKWYEKQRASRIGVQG